LTFRYKELTRNSYFKNGLLLYTTLVTLIKPRRKSLSVLLSFFVPFLGLVYCGKGKRAILLVVPFLIIYLLTSWIFVGRFTGLIIGFCAVFFLFIVNLIESYKGAKNTAPESPQWYQKWYIYLACGAFWIVLPDLVKLNRPYEFYKIPAGSSMPTLMPGDQIVADLNAYKHRSPNRGDLIVFKYPDDKNQIYIKRIVGLPGDTIEVRDKRVIVNGSLIPIKSPPKQMQWVESELKNTGNWRTGMKLYKERLGTNDHWIIQDTLSAPFTNNFPQTSVPDRHYFVMGDNRDHSNDSRFLGTLPSESIVGKAIYVWLHIGLSFDQIHFMPSRSGIHLNP